MRAIYQGRKHSGADRLSDAAFIHPTPITIEINKYRER
jgi:hypothetical protein